jgi:plastocyanin
MHPTGVASAAWVFASAPSTVPFYVAGGLLAGWAVLLAAFGVTHPDFPGSEGRARLVMLTTAVLVATTLTAAVLTAGEEEGTAAGEAGRPAPPGPAARTIELRADPSGAPAYDKKQVVVRAGSVAMRFVNPSPAPHDVTIARGAKVVAKTRTVTDGTVTAGTRLTAGEYVFYCSVDAHRAAGMQGALTVR